MNITDYLIIFHSGYYNKTTSRAVSLSILSQSPINIHRRPPPTYPPHLALDEIHPTSLPNTTQSAFYRIPSDNPGLSPCYEASTASILSAAFPVYKGAGNLHPPSNPCKMCARNERSPRLAGHFRNLICISHRCLPQTLVMVRVSRCCRCAFMTTTLTLSPSGLDYFSVFAVFW